MPSMVFISHSSKDRPTADAICAHLESAGIERTDLEGPQGNGVRRIEP
jgi:hypothetical protein